MYDDLIFVGVCRGKKLLPEFQVYYILLGHKAEGDFLDGLLA